MKLFVGLGNPGPKYAGHRHNIGFMALDRIADDHGFAPWRGKFQGAVTEGTLGAAKVLLLKPETFMNDSGRAVQEAARFYKIAPADIVVFHDELDLAPRKIRVKAGGGHAGHNGLRSIHAHMGPDYQRVRLGIGHPGHKDAVSGYVLRDFPKSDADWLDDLLRGIADGAPALAAGDSAKFLNAVSLRVAPPRSGGGAKAGPAKDRGAKGKAAQDRADRTADTAKPDAEAAAAPSADPPPPDTASAPAGRSPLQRLVDKFR